MKKVDSVREAAALGHMSAHSNIYGGAEGGAKNKVTSIIINRNIPLFYEGFLFQADDVSDGLR